MRDLVTVFGGSGFVGTQVVRALARLGYRVRVAVRKPSVAQDIKPLGDVGQIQVIRADIRSPSDIERALNGASACVNLVGILYETPGARFDAVHREGSQILAEACAAKGITRFVQMSALGADPASKSAYARSKELAEKAVLKAIPTAVVLRPSIVFGADDSFFNRFAQMALYSPVLPLIGGGTTRYQPAYVEDVAEAVALSISQPQHAGKTFSLGGPQVYSFKDLMQIVVRETQRPRVLLPLPYFVASFIALGGDMQALVMPPVLTSDQLKLLRLDNVVPAGEPGFEAFGLQPRSVEVVVPTYLWRYRDGGQFAPKTA